VIFGLPDFIILTLIFPVGLGILVALDAMGRGQSDGACIAWFLFAWFLWPVALLVYYLVVVEKYRGSHRTSTGIKISTAFLILLIIATALAGFTLAPATLTGREKPTGTPTPTLPIWNKPGTPDCYIVSLEIEDWGPNNETVLVNLDLSNSGGAGYIKVQYYTDKGPLTVQEYYVESVPRIGILRIELPWNPEYEWIKAEIIEQRPA